MRIAIIVEGRTERVFMESLRGFLQPRLPGRMPKFDVVPFDGRIPKGERLKRIVENLLGGREPADAVIALTDVYTGTRDFIDAAAAKDQMRRWVGENPKFHPHAAQHDFEAGLLPYWPTIQRLAGHNKKAPPGDPEKVDHNHPPSARIKEIFEIGRCRDSYSKPRDAGKILKDNNLLVAANACPELKALLNTILSLCGGEMIP